jgi:alcohol dehydrogenase
MLDFDFCSPTKIYFGEGKESLVGKIIKEYGFKKVLIHYGKTSVIKSGLLDLVKQKLDEEHIEYVIMGGVEANPDVSLVREGISLARQENVDMILALGGGSVLDSSKAIAHGVFYDGDVLDISKKIYVSKKALPIGSIITIAAAGSELSTSCVISDRTTKFKSGFNSELNRPLFAIENPKLTYSLPHDQVGYGIVDIISHTFERYFNKSDDCQLSDYFAEGLIKDVIKASNILLDKDFYDYDARSEIMLASSLSHNGLTSLGKNSYMPIHQLEHQLSGIKPFIPHGGGLAILIPSWMEVCYKYDIDKFYKFALNVMEVEPNDDKEKAILESIKKLKDFFIKLGMPTSLNTYGISEDDIMYMVNNFSKNGTYTFPSNIPLNKELSEKIYFNALGGK